MKRPIFIVALLVMLCCNSYGQKRKISNNRPAKKITIIDPNKIMGIGIFTMGCDTSILVNYATTHVSEIWDVKYYTDYDYHVKRHHDNSNLDLLLRLKHPTDNYEGVIGLSNSPDVSEYYLTSYVVAGITPHMWLLFHGECDTRETLI